MPEIILKANRDKSVRRLHPWIFSGAVARITGEPQNGETVDVISATGDFLAKAAVNPKSNIVGRIWTWDITEQVNEHFLESRLIRAVESRNKLNNWFHTDAIRLVHGESDGLPGFILDKYGDAFVVQISTAGIEFWKELLIQLIIKNTGAKLLYERSDLDVRELEGLPQFKGPLHGRLSTNFITIQENDLIYNVDIINGHKTGFYLDQRENRLIARQLAHGLKVLDCFSYTGGFAVNALAGNAESVTLVDTSSKALVTAQSNIVINNLSMEKVNLIELDVFGYLRTLRDVGESYDMIILDPPKFAPTSAQVERASRAYKDINLLALKILRPGGYLMTFSCSGGVSEDLFQKIISGAALDAGVNAVILKRMHQAIDHPVAVNFPEGAYLKGFLVQKRM